MLAIIGGSGLYALAQEASPASTKKLNYLTVYGPTSAPITQTFLADQPVLFLPRHGEQHGVPPHLINYRANINALKQAGATRIVAIATVGGIAANLEPGDLVLPNQLIDYTWGRAHTFFDGVNQPFDPWQMHVDFTQPYDAQVRQQIKQAAESVQVPVQDGGCYGCTQGPRLESAAEIDRLERDGCTIVGMTGMPEAALALEAQLPYAALCVVVNKAAGRNPTDVDEQGNPTAQSISMEQIVQAMQDAQAQVMRVLQALIARA